MNKKEIVLEILKSFANDLSPDLEEEILHKSSVSDLHLPERTDETGIPLFLRGNIAIIHKGDNKDGKRIIAGYANVAVIDDEEQFIPLKTLEDGIKTLIEDANYANLMLMHRNIQIGKIIESYGELQTKVDDKGLFIVCEIRKNLNIANEVWGHILDNEIKSFSIGCEVLKDHEECDDEKCITVLDKINIFEVSVCSNPVNKESGFVIISKSQNKSLSVCEECKYTEEDNMAEKKQKEEISETKVKTEEKPEKIVEEKTEEKTDDESKTEEEKTDKKIEENTKEDEDTKEDTTPEEKGETQELSLEDRLDGITQQINALEATVQALLQEPEEDEPEEDTPEGTEEEPEEEEFEKTAEDPQEGDMIAVGRTGPEVDKFDELKKSIDTVLEKLDNLAKLEEMKTELKARDDQINALSKSVEIITKSKVKDDEPDPKTIPGDKELELEKHKPIVVEKGIVYKSRD